jgi:protein-tyrosine phosphatase
LDRDDGTDGTGTRLRSGLNGVALTVVAVVVGLSTPKPTAVDATSPRIVGARADCSAGTTCTVGWELARPPVRVFAGATPGTIDRSHAVAVVRSGTEVRIAVPDADRPIYFEVVPRRAKHGSVVADRLLALEGSPNTRDLGGYGTYDGRFLRWRRLFRTDGLDTLTDADRTRLAAIGLPSTCRTADADGTGDGAPLDAAAVRAAAVANVTDPAIRKQHGALLRALARGDLPRFVSCSLLDDRTGWPVALVLSTLGVPKETIVGDYLQSNQFGGTPPADRAYLDAGYETVREKYRSFDKYLVKGLGLDEDTYLKLRERLLD